MDFETTFTSSEYTINFRNCAEIFPANQYDLHVVDFKKIIIIRAINAALFR